MFIYSVLVETLIIKAPDLKALYIWKNHWKTLTGSFVQIYKTKNFLIDQLKYRKCRKESLTRNWIQRIGKLQRNEGIWPITFIVKEKCPIKFNLIVFFNYKYILFPPVDFYWSNIKKDDLKPRSERRKQKQGNLNSNFIFLF